MKPIAWKWMFGVSLTLFVLLIVFVVGIWALGNATGAMLGAIMGSLDPDNFGYQCLSLHDFLAGAVGSPMFYIGMADLAVLLCSSVALIATRRMKG